MAFLQQHAQAIPSSFGGGWIVPCTPEGERTLEVFFDEPAAYLCPIGKTGWIIEPWQVIELAEYLEGLPA